MIINQPNTEEMDRFYNEIINRIDNQNGDDDVKLFVIDSMGGSGKSTFAKKVYHYVHSKNKIVKGKIIFTLITTYNKIYNINLII